MSIEVVTRRHGPARDHRIALLRALDGQQVRAGAAAGLRSLAIPAGVGLVDDPFRPRGLGSTPGTAAEVLHDGVRERISPNKLPVDRWVEIIEASHMAGLRSTVTVMFGHIEEPAELAEHMRVVRSLQDHTGGFTEFVPLLIRSV